MSERLTRRIERLEATAAVRDSTRHVVHQIIVGPEEDEAVARYQAEHPELVPREPAVGEFLPVGLIVRKIVNPPAREDAPSKVQPPSST